MKHLFCIVVLAIAIILMSGCIDDVEAKEWSISVSERLEGKSIHCKTQTVNDNRMLVCSERNFELGPMIPVKKPISKPSNTEGTKPLNSDGADFLRFLNKNAKVQVKNAEVPVKKQPTFQDIFGSGTKK